MKSRHPFVADIQLGPDVAPENFLRVVIFDYETAARFILDWASYDTTTAAEFLAKFLSKVHSELHTTLLDHDLGSRAGVLTTFPEPRPSISSIALHRFCELIFESPALIALVQADPNYARRLGDSDFFSDRQHNFVALERGRGWSPDDYRFADPEPIPHSVKLAYAERKRVQEIAEQQASVVRERQQAEEQQALRQAIKEARQRAVRPKVIEEQRRSAEHKAFRERFAAKSLLEQIHLLARDTKYSIKVFPIDLNEISIEVLRQIDRDTLDQLLHRVSSRWEKYWKELVKRIQIVQQGQDQSLIDKEK
jgi:hypothetical protein